MQKEELIEIRTELEKLLAKVNSFIEQPRPGTPIESVIKSRRLLNALASEKISTTEQLEKMGTAQIKKIPNIGKGALQVLEGELAEHGIKLSYYGKP